MELSSNIRKAYSEIDEFLGLITEEQREKIPIELRKFFEKEKDKNYTKGIKADVPVSKQNFMEETLAIIALLNLKYWCEDEDEKQRLKSVYDNNEKLYKEMLQIEFNPDNVFKNKDKSIVNEGGKESNAVTVTENKESILKKILSKIKRLFSKK